MYWSFASSRISPSVARGRIFCLRDGILFTFQNLIPSIKMFPPDTPTSKVEMLLDLTSSTACKHARTIPQIYCRNGSHAGDQIVESMTSSFTDVIHFHNSCSLSF
mmetsp:Transcript_5676/g.6563  ORF Transcript_5676/g.6563 Transcript_5676/m.6563 type:complete len:105 (-) Transcript_5676:166-480(-)